MTTDHYLIREARRMLDWPKQDARLSLANMAIGSISHLVTVGDLEGIKTILNALENATKIVNEQPIKTT